jgi:hypothetical protein
MCHVNGWGKRRSTRDCIKCYTGELKTIMLIFACIYFHNAKTKCSRILHGLQDSLITLLILDPRNWIKDQIKCDIFPLLYKNCPFILFHLRVWPIFQKWKGNLPPKYIKSFKLEIFAVGCIYNIITSCKDSELKTKPSVFPPISGVKTFRELRKSSVRFQAIHVWGERSETLWQTRCTFHSRIQTYHFKTLVRW